MFVPVFGEDRYTIQDIKMPWMGAPTVHGMQPGKGGARDRCRCDLRLYKRLVSTQKQNVCGPKVIIK